MLKRLFVPFMLVLMIVPSMSMAQEDGELPVYRINIQVDPAGHRIAGTVRIAFSDTGTHDVFVGGLKVKRVLVGAEPVNVTVENGMFTAPAGGHIEIEYEGTFGGSDQVEDVQNVGVVTEGAVGEDGISLVGLWYPTVESEQGMAYFRLAVTMPEGFKAISEADSFNEAPTENGTEFTFVFPHPVGGISLAGGRYVESKAQVGEVEVYAYFFPEDQDLAQTYLEHAVEYIRMYEELIGSYPYKRFSVVENFQPTGYSLPTYTLLGRAVVKLPFIVKTSLGHEVLHQWFGNSVYVDYEKGNWSEGLTAYLSDQLYDALEGKGPEHRKNLLLKYRGFVRPDNDFPLRSFFSRNDFASTAVGYGKGAMVFHMLRGEIGDEAFYSALGKFTKTHEFKNATWDDLRSSFEDASGSDLGWFFEQWVARKGALSFSVSDERVTNLGLAYRVDFTLTQEGRNRFRLPVYVVMEDETLVEDFVDIKSEKQKVSITVPLLPKELVLDPGYDLMRELTPDEAPPIIAALLGAENRLAVLPSEGEERARYAPLIELLENQGFTLKPADEVKDEDIRTSSVLVIGLESPVLKRLYGYRPPLDGDQEPAGFTLVTLRNPFNPRLVVAGVHSSSTEETALAAHKIFRYSTYSVLHFSQGRNVEKSRGRERAGTRINLEHRVMAIAPSQAFTLDDIIAAVMDVPIIYVGEGHPNYEDHKVQLRIIEDLHSAGRPFVVGMEMFQRPYQAPLDDYISGKTQERQFLKDSEYYKRWKFNYYLYREILNYCREHGIPVVALNIKAEIIKAVSRGGLDSLDTEERTLVPADMDMSDHEYQDRLREVFGQHAGQQASKAFENFYQAQVLWDETMAHTIAAHFREHPGTQMVVIAGAGHVVYGSGIPKRANRLTGLDYAVLVPSASVERLDRDVADFVFFAEHLEAPESPMLGVMLEKEDEGLTIQSVAAGSLGEKAGLKKGDVIMETDSEPVEDIEDLRIALFGKEPGDSMDLKIKRKRFLFGYKDMELTVKF